ncbi:MAG: hypothetical protein WDO56_28385 [Gammaproteobacteria bacterium]
MLYRLREGGFQAFLVGGCVRDLLIGMEPKDFDVATDALPEDVKKLFRNCRLIGRRFRLAHVFFGRETIEVATFRAAAAPEPGEDALPDIEGEDADADGQPLESAADFEAELAAELDDDSDDGEEGDDLDDTVTLLPDAELAADLANDEREAAERTAEMPVPPPGLLAEAQLAAAADADSSGPTMEMPAIPRESGSRPPADYSTASRAAGVRDGGGRGGRRRDRFDEEADTERVLDTHGRILRDNVYGNIDEDVWRRDFTANSLYYNIADFSLWDYVGGAEDIAARRLRLIGDPETRFREDPVRMLRAARFEAKLNFSIDPPTAAPINELRGLLAHVPPARLFDETLKLFLSGHGEFAASKC